MNSIQIYPNPTYPAARAEYNDKIYDAVVGKSGVVPVESKIEGDNATPAGTYGIIGGYYRPDVLDRPDAEVHFTALKPDDIWIDDQSDSRYNSAAKLSAADGSSYEEMWRDDHLYNIILDLDYNRSPAIPGMGSAIFVHVARDLQTPENTPTAGCIAFRLSDLLEIIQHLPKDATFVINQAKRLISS